MAQSTDHTVANCATEMVYFLKRMIYLCRWAWSRGSAASAPSGDIPLTSLVNGYHGRHRDQQCHAENYDCNNAITLETFHMDPTIFAVRFSSFGNTASWRVGQ